jgi:hypothetical protein
MREIGSKSFKGQTQKTRIERGLQQELEARPMAVSKVKLRKRGLKEKCLLFYHYTHYCFKGQTQKTRIESFFPSLRVNKLEVSKVKLRKRGLKAVSI